MIKINDPEMLDRYIDKYNIEDVFTSDMRSYMELLLYKKNEHICREKDVLSCLLFFLEGKAKVYTTMGNGRSLLLCFYQEFKVLGELELLRCEAASTNIQAIEDTYCISIPSERVKACLINDARFLRFISSSIGEKLLRCTKNSSINLLYPLESRLASYILAAGESAYVNKKRVIKFSENLTEISELLGTSYRHLLRTLNTLCLRGILEKKGSCFQVTDESMLRELAADLYK